MRKIQHPLTHSAPYRACWSSAPFGYRACWKCFLKQKIHHSLGPNGDEANSAGCRGCWISFWNGPLVFRMVITPGFQAEGFDPQVEWKFFCKSVSLDQGVKIVLTIYREDEHSSANIKWMLFWSDHHKVVTYTNVRWVSTEVKVVGHHDNLLVRPLLLYQMDVFLTLITKSYHPPNYTMNGPPCSNRCIVNFITCRTLSRLLRLCLSLTNLRTLVYRRI